MPFISYPKPKDGFSPVPESKMREFNKIRFHGPKKLACYNPFVNLYFNSRGQGVVCCRNQDTVLGTYPQNTINEIWFGSVAEKLREHMLNNDLSMGCGYCEHQFNTSRFYGLPSMHADFYSSTKKTYPKIIELELSNTCNLQCVMCSGIVSSTIRKCRENLPPLENPYDDNFVKQLEEYLPHAKEIKFYGGEPFLIETYYKIWDKLLAINSTAKLHVVTNGTVLNDKVRNYLNKLNFTITVSFDAMNKELFESIRVGADFDKVRSNILEYNKILGGKGLSLSVTPMKSNCREVPAIIDFCNSMNATINMSFVENPADMALWTMPSKELKELELFYESYKFESAKGVNANYNLSAFSQFLNQIRQYRIINTQREDDFFQNLKTQDECLDLLNEILDKAIHENIFI
jgi:MoaA/NifB/PqqE/SkfB family radical SAM enzyme